MRTRKIIAVVISLIIFMMMFSGCSDKANEVTSTSSDAAETASGITPIPTLESAAQDNTEPLTTAIVGNQDVVNQLDSRQWNSICMLNYLAYVTEGIIESSDSRLYLEETYSSLYNNTHPNAVDDTTNEQLLFILDTIESYRMIDVKRDRLQFIYEQDQAQAIRDAVPSPMAILTIVQADNWKKMITSIAYTAIDSYTRYKSSSSAATLQMIQNGWELTDEESRTLHNIRKETLNYLHEIVSAYELPGELTLSGEAIQQFVTWKNETNVYRRIRYFESNQKTYEAFGEYWLVMAESYYECGRYSDCLAAINTYLSLNIKIFRRDHHLASTIPYAIASAKATYSDEAYIQSAEYYLALLVDNTSDRDWALRYFATQVYLDLFKLTQDDTCLRNAYEITLDTVNYLVNEQISLNESYVSDPYQETIPADATKEHKKEIEARNKALKKEWEMARPSISSPLMLNCDMLFALADKLDLSDGERADIDSILHEGGASLFKIPAVDYLYNMDSVTPINIKKVNITFTGNTVTLPVVYFPEGASITAVIAGTEYIDDWQVQSVKRTSTKNVNSYQVTLTSDSAKKHKWVDGDAILFTIVTVAERVDTTVSFIFEAVNTKDQWYEYINFFDSGIEYKRVK